MLVLAVSDVVDEGLSSNVAPVRGAELVLACGDLPFDYLAYLMDALDVPLVFVPGNHDPDLSGYANSRNGLVLRAGMPTAAPWPPGATNADARVVDVMGLRIAGLGGSLRYSDGPNQYSERQFAHRARLLRARAWWCMRDGVRPDVLITHAPPRGVGDADDAAHRGVQAMHGLVAALTPPLVLHGHVHPYGPLPRPLRLGSASVRNVVGRHLLDIPARRGYTDERAANRLSES
ncbi:MAG: metallophosphoesterase [Actinomycetota bacterium]|nr:metallophosphoesterase [Actinomycetota bacterium]